MLSSPEAPDKASGDVMATVPTTSFKPDGTSRRRPALHTRITLREDHLSVLQTVISKATSLEHDRDARVGPVDFEGVEVVPRKIDASNVGQRRLGTSSSSSCIHPAAEKAVEGGQGCPVNVHLIVISSRAGIEPLQPIDGEVGQFRCMDAQLAQAYQASDVEGAQAVGGYGHLVVHRFEARQGQLDEVICVEIDYQIPDAS
ncbi:hypothetical protein PgNI_11281 [Pyricularia grisea]|uniref:Uncharacterized protein n=1 Tax=Pyricularia grisea TaxID=148305 RepID=A0A6P8APX3_PYRGI|nr:hypothetical protein PgNI_11281 [Pyricularia grisea]TLD04099.1 hypothetical protein PgNI_11281 [Pyricularia grisea]